MWPCERAAVVRRDLISVLEAAYTLGGTEHDWLGRLLDAMRDHVASGLAGIGFFFDRRKNAYLEDLEPVAQGLTPETSSLLTNALRASGAQIRSLSAHGPPVATASSVLGEQWTGLLPILRGAFSLANVSDVLTLRCEDPSGRGCALSVTIPSARPLRSGEHATWARVMAHVLAGLRLKRRPPGPAGPLEDDATDAVLTPAGRVEHAVGAARSRSARDRLALAGTNIERARGKVRRLDPSEALDLWLALVAGRWSLVDHFDSDGRRYLIARRNAPVVEAAEASCNLLPPRELQVVAYAALGHTNKLIAYELGLAASTVAVRLASAARKLRAASRLELIRRFQAASVDATDPS
jgi:DNA-binding CsgD family transcriptional regulator